MSGSPDDALEQAVRAARTMDAPLAEKLRFVADAVRALSAPFAEAVDRAVARQMAAGVGQGAPAPGEVMPDFALPNEAGQIVTLSRLLARGPAVLSFNRGHWCPYCRLNTSALAEAHGEIASLGGQLAIVVPDRQPFTAALQADSGAAYTVLTDLDNGYALLLNLAVWVGEEMEGMMSAAGIDLARYQGNTSFFVPVPATFVVAQSGQIAARFLDPDYRRRAETRDLIAAIRALGAPQP